MKHLKTYNESLRDFMKPKSEDEINISFNKYLDKLKKSSEDKYNDGVSEHLKYILEIIYDDRKKLINDLMDEGIEPDDLLVTITDDISGANNERQYQYRLFVQKCMYNLIEKNKDKINLDEI